jgi:hypothetical protein
MLLCTANVFWQDMRTGGEPATRDTAGVKEAFSRAVAAAARAEKLFRGERWGHPGALYLDVLDAAKQFRSRGCELTEVQNDVERNVARLASEGARVLGAPQPRECWTDALQARLEAIRAISDEPLDEP